MCRATKPAINVRHGTDFGLGVKYLWVNEKAGTHSPASFLGPLSDMWRFHRAALRIAVRYFTVKAT
jgi:hypothetical protein